jgi:hypothetical protein
MMRQHKRQQRSIDLAVAVVVEKDVAGYEVRYVKPARGRYVVDIEEGRSEIVGRSGETATVTYRMDKNYRIWQKARRVMQYDGKRLAFEKSLDDEHDLAF